MHLNIMHLNISPKRPIDPETLEVIREVTNVATTLKLNVFIVGATARIILLEHIFELPIGRATRDIDFAFAVESWDQFHTLKEKLTTDASFQQAKHAAQRLIYKPPSGKLESIVDLIPFGGLETDTNIIAWPPDMRVLMNVAGYQDAYDAAVQVEVEPGVIISLASIPGIAILKIFAWVDRGQENSKDALDLVSLLRQYHETGNQDRLYEEGIKAFEDNNYDIELTGAWLLGKDTSAIVQPATKERLEELFANSARMDDLAGDMSQAIPLENKLDHSHALLEQFLKGFAHADN